MTNKLFSVTILFENRGNQYFILVTNVCDQSWKGAVGLRLSSGAAGRTALPPSRAKARSPVLRSAASACWSPSATSLSRSALHGSRALSQRARAALPPRLRLFIYTLGVGQTRPRG